MQCILAAANSSGTYQMRAQRQRLVLHPSRREVRVRAAQRSSEAQQGHSDELEQSRREALLGLVGLTASTSAVCMLSSPSPAHARMDLPNKEVDDATSPMIQAMLARTAEKREERRKERLDDYYKRNFKDYFEYEADNARVAKARGLSDQTSKEIAAWLEKNK